jgi:hypothetical protein
MVIFWRTLASRLISALRRLLVAFGVKFVNDAGTVQVDENYANLALRAKATVTTTTLAPVVGGGTSYVDVVYTGGSTPMLALSCAALAAAPQLTVSGTTFTWRVYVLGAVGTAVTYYVFDRPAASTETHGVRVRDAAGSLTFDSGQKYLRVIDTVDLAGSGGVGTKQYPAGKAYAVAAVKPGVQVTGFNVQAEVWTRVFAFGARTVSTDVSWGQVTVHTAPGSPQLHVAYGGLLILDVTNY